LPMRGGAGRQRKVGAIHPAPARKRRWQAGLADCGTNRAGGCPGRSQRMRVSPGRLCGDGNTLSVHAARAGRCRHFDRWEISVRRLRRSRRSR
jgi:hypothetical protein